jgi:hypothetical protein
MKKLHRLTDRTVKTTSPGKYHDGAGLYLIVTQGRSGINRNWMFRYSLGRDRQRWCGLGAYPLVSLAEAVGGRRMRASFLPGVKTQSLTRLLYGLLSSSRSLPSR